MPRKFPFTAFGAPAWCSVSFRFVLALYVSKVETWLVPVLLSVPLHRSREEVGAEGAARFLSTIAKVIDGLVVWTLHLTPLHFTRFYSM